MQCARIPGSLVIKRTRQSTRVHVSQCIYSRQKTQCDTKVSHVRMNLSRSVTHGPFGFAHTHKSNVQATPIQRSSNQIQVQCKLAAFSTKTLNIIKPANSSGAENYQSSTDLNQNIWSHSFLVIDILLAAQSCKHNIVYE